MDKVDVTIVGAGIVGLAVAAELADGRREVVVLERQASFGRETSSRSSEVVHSGVYYPPGSLRARLCVEGNALIYELCAAEKVPFRKPGKLLVAVDEQEEEYLGELLGRARENGCAAPELLGPEQLKALEPELEGRAALHLPSTGIVDSHGLMACLERRARGGGVQLAYGTELLAVGKAGGGYELGVRDADGRDFTFSTRALVNSGGLYGERVAALAGVDVAAAGYVTRYSKGEFFRVSAAKQGLVKRLIYPVPRQPGYTGLHTITDLQGAMKLGPYAYTVTEVDYAVDGANLGAAFEAARRFLPFLEQADLAPDMSGIQAKLDKPGEDWHDFVISEESVRGLPGLVNLVGIDSPGLTAAPAIGRYVARLVG